MENDNALLMDKMSSPKRIICGVPQAVAKPARQFSHAMQIFRCLQAVKTINF